MTGPARVRRTVARSKVVSAALGVALIAVAAIAYQVSTPAQDRYEVRDAPFGELTRYNSGQLEVSDLRVGSALRRQDQTILTAGAFVVVKVTVLATGRDTVRVSEARLLSRGPTYVANNDATAVTAAPGFEASADVVFEVDPTQLDDATVELWTAGVVDRYHLRTHTHLGITAANATGWAESARNRQVDVDPLGQTQALS